MAFTFGTEVSRLLGTDGWEACLRICYIYGLYAVLPRTKTAASICEVLVKFCPCESKEFELWIVVLWIVNSSREIEAESGSACEGGVAWRSSNSKL